MIAKTLDNLIHTKHPTAQEGDKVFTSLDKLSSPEGCTHFIAKASTSKVYRVCRDTSPCGKCLAVKIPINDNSLDSKEADVGIQLTAAFKGTCAEVHFNKIRAIVPSSHGPLIISQYEEQVSGFSKVSDLLQQRKISKQLWKSINFQFIKAIYCAQLAVPWFSHNDTHTENVMLVPNDTNHTCIVTSPKGIQLAHHSNVILKIIDFGQVLAKDPRLQTDEGQQWKDRGLWGNKMLDYHRFLVWAIDDLFFYNDSKEPDWYKEWLDFVLRFFTDRMIPDKFNPKDKYYLDKREFFHVTKTGPSVKYIPTPLGSVYLQKYYGPRTSKSIGDMLDDDYFQEYRVDKISFTNEVTK